MPKIGSSVSGVAGVRFFTDAIKDKKAIGNLDLRFVYKVRYSAKKKNYFSWRSKAGQQGPDGKDNLPGDPTQGEVNIYGVIFLFNEAGELIDHKGNVVGTFTCYLLSQ